MSEQVSAEQWLQFNVNHHVRVKVTARGREVMAREGVMKAEDADGWSEWQLWELMNVFGPAMFNGCQVPFETTIQINTDPQQ